MTVSARDIEKLKAIGVSIQGSPNGPRQAAMSREEMERDQWQGVYDCMRGPWLKATMADKVRWLGVSGCSISVSPRGEWTAKTMLLCYGVGNSPEAAVDALFWKVP